MPDAQPPSPWARPGETPLPPAGPAPGTGWQPSPPPPPGTGWQPAPPPGWPGGPQPPGWPGAPGPTGTEGLAIASFVLGLVSIVLCPIVPAIVGLILASQARSKIDASYGRLGGRSLATAGKVLSIIGLVMWVLIIGGITTAAILTNDEKSLTAIDVGDCFNVPRTGRVVRVNGQPCDDDHDAEAVGIVVHPAGINEPYPGAKSLNDYAAPRCAAQFAAYVGREPTSSRFGLTTLTPLDNTWTRRHVRRIVCLAVDPEGAKLNSSVQNANQ